MASQFQFSDIKNKFAKMGTLSGLTQAEIVQQVGLPNSVSSLPEGKKLLQWQHTSQAGAYHIALIFSHDDICEGVSHEFST